VIDEESGEREVRAEFESNREKEKGAAVFKKTRRAER